MGDRLQAQLQILMISKYKGRYTRTQTFLGPGLHLAGAFCWLASFNAELSTARALFSRDWMTFPPIEDPLGNWPFRNLWYVRTVKIQEVGATDRGQSFVSYPLCA